MRRILVAAAAVTASVLSLALGATPASAAEGNVIVFSTELTPLTTYQNPSGCYKLPAAAHVLDNLTDSTVTIYLDPFCVTPGLAIQPGYGSHVAAGSGSFSA